MNVHGFIVAMQRMKSSDVGNPRWLITMSDGKIYRTKPNAGWVYGIGTELEDKAVDLTIDGRGNIAALKVVK